jgi:hypothetical protein
MDRTRVGRLVLRSALPTSQEQNREVKRAAIPADLLVSSWIRGRCSAVVLIFAVSLTHRARVRRQEFGPNVYPDAGVADGLNVQS